ncbi:hypothetical protein DITRI_Ditri01bG0204200 [Diplodiscus trichospermus]
MSASNKFTHSLNIRGKRKIEHGVPSVSIEDVRDAKEESVVHELRQKLLDKDLLPPRHDDYHTLLRFLKAREFNIEKTIRMWEEMLKWRKEFGTDTILEDFEFEELEEVLQYHPQGYHGVDKEGRPVYIERLGKAHPSRLMCITSIDRAKRQICSRTTILDVQGLGMKNFSRPAANLLASMTKIDNSYYPENLHSQCWSWIRKMLWPVFQKFLDEKTIGSQLPDFLGGSCTCSTDGGCLRSNKGPWNDPGIMKLVHNAEATFARQITRVSKDHHKYDSYVQIRSLKRRISDTSAVESGSDIDDQCTSIGQRSSAFPCLAQVHEEVRISDPNAYYSCDDSLPLVEKTVESDQGPLYSLDPLPTSINVDSQSHQQASSFHREVYFKFIVVACMDSVLFAIWFHRCDADNLLNRTSVIHWFDTVKEKVGRRNIQSVAKMLIALLVKLATFIRTFQFEFWRKPNNIHPSNMIEFNMNSHSNSTASEAVNEEDHVLPCIERLQKLEKALEELKNKRAGIPIEKEKMLMESLDRIKSVELDLEKT